MLDELQLGKRLRFYAGNGVRLFSGIWNQHKIQPEDACTIFGASFADAGWHHWRRTLEEYDLNNKINIRETTLWSYLKNFCPTSVSILAGVDYDEPPLPLFVYPWGTFRKGESVTSKNPRLSRFCGPSDDTFIEEEFRRTISLYNSMRSSAYQPWRFGNTFIGGTWLVNKEGRRRFVVLQGNHRMAILAHLGVRDIAVRPIKGWLPAVREKDILDWSLVKADQCSVRHAQTVFEWLYESDGYYIEDRRKLKPFVSDWGV